MPYQDVNGQVVKITIATQFNTQNQVQECNWHLVAGPGLGGDTRAMLAAQINSLVIARIIPHMHPKTTFLGTRLMPIHADAPYAPTIANSNTVGVEDAPQIPTQVRLVVSMRTALAGRKYRGRIYAFTPTIQAESSEGIPTSSFILAWTGFLDTFRAGLTVGSTTWNLCIYHPWRIPQPAIPVDLVTQVYSRGDWGTQRRSGDYGKTNVAPW